MKCKHDWKEIFRKEQKYTRIDTEHRDEHNDNTRKTIFETKSEGIQTILILNCSKCGDIDKTIVPGDRGRYC